MVSRASGAVHVLLNAPATPPQSSSFVVAGKGIISAQLRCTVAVAPLPPPLPPLPLPLPLVEAPAPFVNSNAAADDEGAEVDAALSTGEDAEEEDEPRLEDPSIIRRHHAGGGGPSDPGGAFRA